MHCHYASDLDLPDMHTCACCVFHNCIVMYKKVTATEIPFHFHEMLTIRDISLTTGGGTNMLVGGLGCPRNAIGDHRAFQYSSIGETIEYQGQIVFNMLDTPTVGNDLSLKPLDLLFPHYTTCWHQESKFFHLPCLSRKQVWREDKFPCLKKRQISLS